MQRGSRSQRPLHGGDVGHCRCHRDGHAGQGDGWGTGRVTASRSGHIEREGGGALHGLGDSETWDLRERSEHMSFKNMCQCPHFLSHNTREFFFLLQAQTELLPVTMSNSWRSRTAGWRRHWFGQSLSIHPFDKWYVRSKLYTKKSAFFITIYRWK